ncbi:hypothetical protein HDV05_005848, partial [Chytridiales sp. JEL 0842]
MLGPTQSTISDLTLLSTVTNYLNAPSAINPPAEYVDYLHDSLWDDISDDDDEDNPKCDADDGDLTDAEMAEELVEEDIKLQKQMN